MDAAGNLTAVVNLGLRSVRAIVFDGAFRKVSQSSLLPIRTFIHGDHVEQNPLEWWELSKRVLQEALSNVQKSAVAKVTVTSSSCCLVPVDGSGSPLTNAIMVSDKRSKKEAKDLYASPLLEGLWKKPNFLPLPSFMPPKMLWLSRNRRDVFSDVSLFLGSNDYLTMKLCGSAVTDALNAEKFYYDQDEKQYSQEMLDFLGVEERMLPRVAAMGSSAGPVDHHVASELGLSRAAGVVVSTYDALCAFWGSGVHDYGVAANACGTCSSLRVASQKPVQPNSRGILSQYFPFSGVHVVGGSNNLEGGLLEWAKNCFYADHQWKGSEYIYELMCQEASESQPGANGLMFMPYLLGERTPFFDPNVRGVFFGMERFHTRKDIIRSIFESIGLLSLDMVRGIESFGVPIKEIRISGGLSKNDLVCQIKADFTGKAVFAVDEIETTSLGAAILASLPQASGVPLQSMARHIKVKKVSHPNNELTRKYHELYGVWKSLYASTAEVFRQRSALSFDSQQFEVENL
jgi:xylulokinase